MRVTIFRFSHDVLDLSRFSLGLTMKNSARVYDDYYIRIYENLPRAHGQVLWCPEISHHRSLRNLFQYLHRRSPSLLQND